MLNTTHNQTFASFYYFSYYAESACGYGYCA